MFNIQCLLWTELSRQIPSQVKQSNIAINKALVGEIDKAKKNWAKIIMTNEDYSEPLIWKALIPLQQGNDSIAINYLDRAIYMNSTVSGYYFTKAGILQKLGKPDLAIKQL